MGSEREGFGVSVSVEGRALVLVFSELGVCIEERGEGMFVLGGEWGT